MYRFSKFVQAIIGHKYLWTIVLFLLIIGVLDNNSLISRYQLHARNAELREHIAEYDRQYREDSQRMQQLRESPKAVENVARVSLFMKTPDEDVYVVEEVR